MRSSTRASRRSSGRAGRPSASALPRRKPSLGELVGVGFALFVVVPFLFSAIGLVAYAAQNVQEIWAINTILLLTTFFFIFGFLKGIRLAARLIHLIDK